MGTASQIVPAQIGLFLASDLVIAWRRWIVADVEGNTRLAGSINSVTAQHAAWIEQLRQDILASPNDWALSGRRS